MYEYEYALIREKEKNGTLRCDDICEYAQHCHFGKKEVGKKPEQCSEYLLIEKCQWDAECDRWEAGREYEDEDDSCGDYEEDDFTEDDLI